jgi:glycosyltransferase involved in cell wall biosynthesis
VKRRAVVLVGNPAAPYSRGLRIARALAAEGYAVEIAAIAGPGVAEHEVDGAIEIHRYRPSGPFASMAADFSDGTRLAGGDEGAGTIVDGRTTRRRTIRLALRAPLRAAAALRRWLFWPHGVRGWWATLARDLQPADLYHAFGTLAVPAALAARRRAPIGPSGLPARVVYDAIDDIAGSNNMIGVPSPVVASIGRRERAWARAADARTTVNEALAAGLRIRWGVHRAPLSVPNYPEPPSMPPGERTDLIRAHLGLSATTRIVLFQGRLGPNLGIDDAAVAVHLIPNAAFVLIGFGRWAERSRARDREPGYGGRHFTLPPVHPDELAAWTASADVSVVPLAPISANQRRSTPNKFWESLIVGTPVVIGPGTEVMEQLVVEHDLGRVAASLSPADLAAAIRDLLDRPEAVRAAERTRIAELARDRFSWPAAAARYRTLVRELQP